MRAGWLLLLAGVVVGVAAAAVLSSLSPARYSSTTREFVSMVSPTTDAPTALLATLVSVERTASYAVALTEPDVMGRVIGELGLEMTPDELDDLVAVDVIPGTSILEITVTDTSAERARAIAASLGRQVGPLVRDSEDVPGAPALPMSVTTVQPATLDPVPVSPDVPRDLATGAGLGLLIGLGLALLRHPTDDIVRSEEDLPQVVPGMRLLGEVVRERRIHRRRTGPPEEHTPEGRSFQALRTNLRLLDAARPSQVVVVTGVARRWAGTTVAVDLALAAARSGDRVVLVEVDARRSRAAASLGLHDAPGLFDVLAGAAELEEVLQPWGDDGLAVLAVGSVPPFPAELLQSAAMLSLLHRLRATADLVVVDSPALLENGHAAAVATQADGCLLVARYGRIRRDRFAQAAATVRAYDADLLGVVLSGTPRSGPAGPHVAGYRPDPERLAAR